MKQIKTKEQRTLTEIKTRCLNPRAKMYLSYGGAGITVCERWLGPDGRRHFLEDMGFCPPNKNSIDRIDNTKGYFKENCRWADWFDQANNRTNNTKVTRNGVTMNLGQWAKALGIAPSTVCQRLKYGWTLERALTQPVQSQAR